MQYRKKKSKTLHIVRLTDSGGTAGVLLPGQDAYEALHGRSVQQRLHVPKLAHEFYGFIHSAHSEYLQDVHWTLTVRIRRKTLR